MVCASQMPKPRRKRAAVLTVEEEIAHLRDLDLVGLRARWQSMMGRTAAKHISRHLLFGMLAYRLQADAFGDLDASAAQLLKQAAEVESATDILPLTQKMDQRRQEFAPGTVLTRHWNGQPHRVMVLEKGFAFGGKTYDSLSKIAFAITGTNWNGPRFFGLRESVKATAP